MAALRRDYLGSPLRSAALAADWFTQFQQWFTTARQTEAEPNAMVLATASAKGVPSLRTVLCKRADADGLVFFTHYNSRKGREIAEQPTVSLLFGWLTMSRQVSIEGEASPLSQAESDDYFASRPYGAKIGTLASRQSSVLNSREELEAAASRLAERYPEDAAVPRPADWGGIRVRPHTVEFWQGRPNRLHDRLRYRFDGVLWRTERLAP